jgi:polysaccharide deacetylase family protein (PEP-CTERM system associated)
MRALGALSIDLEDWYHPELVRRSVPADERTCLVAGATQPILRLLDRYGVKATFFIVGEVAQRAPRLVWQIVQAGHEIGCHGFSHKPLWELTPATLADELAQYRALIEQIVGPKVPLLGFRAPTFSLDQRTAWAVDVLADAGYRYDSSIFPLKTPLYGVAGAPDAPYRLSSNDVSRPDPAGRLVEFPMNVGRIAGLRLPISGGTYLRLLPMPLLTALLRRVGRRQPFVVYVHPWEMSPLTPRLRLPAPAWLATYVNRDAALDKLEGLLRQFDFAPLHAVLTRGGFLE